jgi:flagellar basal body-associated protein FliL
MHLVAFLLQDGPNQEAIQKLAMAMIAIIPLIIIVMIAIVMIPCWFILKKAGFTPWLSLLCLIPSLGTLVLLYVLAFSEWRVAPAPQAGWQPRPPYPPPPPGPYPPQA